MQFRFRTENENWDCNIRNAQLSRTNERYKTDHRHVIRGMVRSALICGSCEDESSKNDTDISTYTVSKRLKQSTLSPYCSELWLNEYKVRENSIWTWQQPSLAHIDSNIDTVVHVFALKGYTLFLKNHSLTETNVDNSIKELCVFPLNVHGTTPTFHSYDGNINIWIGSQYPRECILRSINILAGDFYWCSSKSTLFGPFLHSPRFYTYENSTIVFLKKSFSIFSTSASQKDSIYIWNLFFVELQSMMNDIQSEDVIFAKLHDLFSKEPNYHVDSEKRIELDIMLFDYESLPQSCAPLFFLNPNFRLDLKKKNDNVHDEILQDMISSFLSPEDVISFRIAAECSEESFNHVLSPFICLMKNFKIVRELEDRIQSFLRVEIHINKCKEQEEAMERRFGLTRSASKIRSKVMTSSELIFSPSRLCKIKQERRAFIHSTRQSKAPMMSREAIIQHLQFNPYTDAQSLIAAHGVPNMLSAISPSSTPVQKSRTLCPTSTECLRSRHSSQSPKLQIVICCAEISEENQSLKKKKNPKAILILNTDTFEWMVVVFQEGWKKSTLEKDGENVGSTSEKTCKSEFHVWKCRSAQDFIYTWNLICVEWRARGIHSVSMKRI